MSTNSREYREMWAAKNPLYQNDYQRTWRKSNPDKIKTINAKAHRKRMSIPEKKEHMRLVRNAWYLKNKIKIRPQITEQYRRRSDAFFAFKEDIGCAKCGYKTHGTALDFHHLDPAIKKCHISVFNYRNAEGKAEIKKCILLCANCHRVETVNQRRSK